jgi:ribonuclease HII
LPAERQGRAAMPVRSTRGRAGSRESRASREDPGLADRHDLLGGAIDLPSGDRVAGVDEAGRGSLAGPVVAAAVVLPANASLPGLADSKQLTPAARARLAELIQAVATTWAVAAIEAPEIDATDILRATLRAMAEAVRQLTPPPELVLVDGNTAPILPMAVRTVIRGDQRVPSISAASILAKVSRDRIMEEWGVRLPGYGFARHKGYGTGTHMAAIARIGPSPIHRRTFAGVREHAEAAMLQGELW